MIGLLVFFALVIPIAIHVISRSQGQIVPFPFLDLLPKQTASTELHLTLQEKRLLLVRLLLTLCACALVSLALLNDWWSQSAISEKFASTPSSPTIIVTQDWWVTSSEDDRVALKQQLDSEDFESVDELVFVPANDSGSNRLISYSKRTAFEEIDRNVTGEGQNLSKKVSFENVWSVAQVVAQTIPTDSPMHIYTSGRYSQFIGATTYVRQPITWHLSGALDNAQKAELPPLKIALINVNELNASEEQKIRMARAILAIQSLKKVYSNIELELVNKKNVHSLNLMPKPFDSLIVDSIDDIPNVSDGSIVQLSKVGSPTQRDFVYALGREIFKEKQQEYLFSNAKLTREQIANGAKIINTAAVSALPAKQDSRWKTVLVVLLVILFVIERLMSELLHSQNSKPLLNSQGQ